MKVERAIEVLDKLDSEQTAYTRHVAWQTIKAAVLAQQANNSVRAAIVAEALLLSKKHPSKDCRFFANSIYEFLQQHPSTNTDNLPCLKDCDYWRCGRCVAGLPCCRRREGRDRYTPRQAGS